MAKGTRERRSFASRQGRYNPYNMTSKDHCRSMHQHKCSKILEKHWEEATCSVCMEYPHNAVLLLCSSHDKGCRPYMCGTNFRFSNCLDQYKKAYTKVKSACDPGLFNDIATGTMSGLPVENCEVTELTCPLCRGQVKGWTVVEPAREYLNAKKRNCVQENCSFVGNYKEIKKHVKTEHPSAKPREVDPLLEQKWKRLESEREREDVISTIRSSMPGAVVFGDYVIEQNHYGSEYDEDGSEDDLMEDDEGFHVGIDRNLMNAVLFLQSAGHIARSSGFRHHDRDSFGSVRIIRGPAGYFNHSGQASNTHRGLVSRRRQSRLRRTFVRSESSDSQR